MISRVILLIIVITNLPEQLLWMTYELLKQEYLKHIVTNDHIYAII